jgi:hypothetical protein
MVTTPKGLTEVISISRGITFCTFCGALEATVLEFTTLLLLSAFIFSVISLKKSRSPGKAAIAAPT